MRKIIMTVMVCLCCVLAIQAQTYWDGTANKVFAGSGTKDDPYLIGTPEQLAGLAERTNTDKEDFAGKIDVNDVQAIIYKALGKE